MSRLFERLLAAVLTGFLGFALVAMPLAMLGAFRPVPVLGGSAVLWVLLYRLWGPGRGASIELDARAAAAALLIVAAATGLNFRYSSQHLLTERDPGVYVTTGRWLAQRGEILIDPQPEPYRGVVNEHRIRFAAAGHYEGHREDGRLYPQFVHLLPATLGATSWIAGARGMLKANALMGGLALLVFFAFASQLVRPWAAVGATAALGFNLVQVHFSRDAYTEIPTQILLFGGLLVLLGARATYDRRRAALAGMLIGAGAMARLDAFIFLVPLAMYVVYEAWVSRPLGSPKRDYLLWLVGGTAPPAVIAYLDARLFSPIYLGDLWASVRIVWIVLAVVAVGGGLALWLAPRFPKVVAHLRSRRAVAATATAVGLVGLAVVAYYIRPHVQTALQTRVNGLVETLQAREGLPVDGRLTYVEESLRWIGLYLGPAALWGGVVGLALLTRAIILGRARKAVPFVLAVLPMSLLYVWNPSITPDHLWAMRRFLPVTIPGLVLACFWLVDRWWGTDSAWWLRSASVALAVGAVAFPIWTLAPVVSHRTQLGLLAATEKLCDHVGEDGAVLVAQTELLDLTLTQTVRSFCGVPSAHAPMDQPMEWYRDLGERWERNGRTLYVVSPIEGFGTFWPPGRSIEVTSHEFRNLERTLRGRPDSYETFEFSLYVRRASEAGLG